MATAKEKWKKPKFIRDPIHGMIEVDPVCMRIIDTPQFQRLRDIKQLDACNRVYPGATHTRFEHSIGTYHLAKRLLSELERRQQPELNIIYQDILCVKIAALCHDMGQGPFSHVFEERFMPSFNKNFNNKETARKMFKYMLEDNGCEVKKDIQEIEPELAEEDFEFIMELIDKPKNIDNQEWPYTGRDASKSFLYEIVHNTRCGVDVDKWDYLARDSKLLGLKVIFDYERLLSSARVISCPLGQRTKPTQTSENEHSNERTTTSEAQVQEPNLNEQSQSPFEGPTADGDQATNSIISLRTTSPDNGVSSHNTSRVGNRQMRRHICFRDKDAEDLYDMFYTRMTLYRKAYKHKVHSLIGTMICEALVKANEVVKFVGTDEEKRYSISDAADDMGAFMLLTDNIFHVIQNAPKGNEVLLSRGAGENVVATCNSIALKEAKDILNDVSKRNLYTLLEKKESKDGKYDAAKLQKDFEDYVKKGYPAEIYILFDAAHFDYGMTDKDPVGRIWFYKKNDIDTPIRLERRKVSFLLPDNFSESVLRIYCSVDESHEEDYKFIKSKVVRWWIERGSKIDCSSRRGAITQTD